MRAAGWRRFAWYVWDQGPGMPGDWNGRLAPSHEFVFHFNCVAEHPRKTKDKRPENIQIMSVARAGTRGGMRRADGSISRRSNRAAGLQPKKIPDTVIRVVRHKAGGGHPAPFPVDLAAEVLTAFSDADDVAYEPFCGSGTTIIASETHGRCCLGMEISPAYCDIAVKRWSKFTGRAAILADDGSTFDEVAQARGVET
jgi:DNA modification methylase